MLQENGLTKPVKGGIQPPKPVLDGQNLDQETGKRGTGLNSFARNEKEPGLATFINVNVTEIQSKPEVPKGIRNPKEPGDRARIHPPW